MPPSWGTRRSAMSRPAMILMRETTAGRPGSEALAEVATSLVCAADEAKRRMQRFKDIGFDEVLLVSHGSVLEDIERARDFV